MNERERHRYRVDAIREYVSTAAAGISLGAAVMALMPVEILQFVGLKHAPHIVAAKIAFVAALVWLAARSSIHVRWK